MGRDCFLDFGYFTIFPNLYIVLIAGSARCKKSTAINMGLRMLKNVKPAVKLLSQKMTPEALISSLSGMTAKDESTIIDKAEGIIIVDEMSTLVDKGAFKSGMISLLIKLYDCDDFSYMTMSRGLESVKNPCLAFLGGSTMQGIKETIPIISIGSGFTSRIVFVYREKGDRYFPFLSLSEENIKRAEDIVHDLGEIAKMRGHFALDDKAKKLYEDEYITFMKTNSLFDMQNLTGYAGRRMTTLLKVSMAMSASRSDSRVIDDKDFMMALKSLELIEADMPRVLKAMTSEVAGDVFEEIVSLLVRKEIVTRSELILHMRHKLTVGELDSVLAGVVESGYVAQESRDGTMVYVLVKGK